MKKKNDIYVLAGILFLIDFLVKRLIIYLIKEHSVITVIPNFFQILLVKNRGAAFSILENNTLLLILISVIFLLFLNNFIKKEKNFTKLSILSLGMIMGGVFGNLLDRMIYKSVIDYLSFHLINYDFPIFNLADIFITVGTGLLLLSMLLEKRKEDNL
ncbi:MAG: signal peptidase II [Bacilli bacterium]|nr:signal peptidase II [Bacilli bacterium]